jgi:hypothetical protein
MRSVTPVLALVAILSVASVARADGISVDPFGQPCRDGVVIGPSGHVECAPPRDIFGSYPDAGVRLLRAGPEPVVPVAHEPRVVRVDVVTPGLVIGGITLAGIALVGWRLRRPRKDDPD